MTKKRYYQILLLSAVAILAVLAVLFGVCVGSVKFSFGETVRALFVDDGSSARLLVYGLRLPRILCAGLCGVCLSLSGCILQGVMRNKMASPSTVGVTGGASFAGYLTLVVFPGYYALLPMGAMIGAFLTSMLICLLAYSRSMSSVKIILAGMAVSSLYGALNDCIRTFFADSIGNASGFLVGGFNGCTWDSFAVILPYALFGIAVCVFLPYKMNILMLGDENADSLGMNTALFRIFLIAVSSLLAGAAVSVGGLISFVGLIVPHIARLITGSDYRTLFPASAFIGFTLVTICDTIGRVIIRPGELPVSIILSIIGVPFFLWLIRTREKGGEN